MFLDKIGHGVSKGFNSFGHSVKSGVSDVGKGIKKTVNDAGHGIGKGFNDLGNGIGKGVSTVYNDVKGLAADTTHYISNTTDQLLSPTTLILIVGGIVGVVVLVSMVKK